MKIKSPLIRNKDMQEINITIQAVPELKLPNRKCEGCLFRGFEECVKICSKLTGLDCRDGK